MLHNGTDYDESVAQMSFEEFREQHIGLRKYARLTEEDRELAVKAEYDQVMSLFSGVPVKETKKKSAKK